MKYIVEDSIVGHYLKGQDDISVEFLKRNDITTLPEGTVIEIKLPQPNDVNAAILNFLKMVGCKMSFGKIESNLDHAYTPGVIRRAIWRLIQDDKLKLSPGFEVSLKGQS